MSNVPSDSSSLEAVQEPALDRQVMRENLSVWVEGIDTKNGTVKLCLHLAEGGIVNPVVTLPLSIFGGEMPELGMTYKANGTLDNLQCRRETMQDLAGIQGAEISLERVYPEQGYVVVQASLPGNPNSYYGRLPISAFATCGSRLGEYYKIDVVDDGAGGAKLVARNFTEAELAAAEAAFDAQSQEPEIQELEAMLRARTADIVASPEILQRALAQIEQIEREQAEGRQGVTGATNAEIIADLDEE